MVVSNAAGANEVIQTDIIEVFSQPTPEFSSTVTDLEVSFTNLSVNADSYAWDFGDNNTSNEENPIHIYNESGNYIVTLTTTNNCGSNTVTQEISILTAPLAGFEFTPQQGCIPLTVQFESTTVGQVENYTWTFEGGTPSTSTEANPIVVYNNPGIFSVSLEVSNASGTDFISQNQIIEALPIPIPSFTTSSEGLTLSIANSSLYADTYFWEFGDGNTSTEENPVHTYQADGNYTVSLTVENNCASFSVNQNITIISAPTASFNAEPNQGCAPLMVQYASTSNGQIDSYEWTFEGGTPASSTEPNPIVMYNEPGLYSTSLEVSNSVGSDLIESINSIEVLPGIEESFFTYTTNGNTVNFTNNALNGNDFFWNFGDTNTSTEENPVHTYLASGTYLVELTISNACETSTIMQEIHVGIELPAVAFDFNYTDNCAPATINFTDSSTGNPTEWLWTFEGGEPTSSTEQNPTVIYYETGSFDVQLSVTNAAGTSSIVSDEIIEVNGIPVANFDFTDQGNNTYQFNNLSQYGDNFEWLFGDGTSSTESSPIHTYDEAGSYSVVFIVENDCGTAVITEEIIITNTTIQLNPDNILLYPNPSNGQFTIDLSETKLDVDGLKIYNTLGQVVQNFNIDSNNPVQIDLSKKASGIYYVELQSNEGLIIKRIIKD